MLRQLCILLLLATTAMTAAPVTDARSMPKLTLPTGDNWYCIWYAPSAAGGVGYCYDYDNNELCIQEPSGAEPCAKPSAVPFLDEDALAAYLWCVQTSDPASCRPAAFSPR